MAARRAGDGRRAWPPSRRSCGPARDPGTPESDHRRAPLPPGRPGDGHGRTVASGDRHLGRGDAGVQFLPAAAVLHADDRRPAELGRAVRLRRRGDHRQPAVGGRATACQRGGSAQAGGHATLRSQPRHPADDRQRAGDCRRGAGMSRAASSSRRLPSACRRPTAGRSIRAANAPSSHRATSWTRRSHGSAGRSSTTRVSAPTVGTSRWPSASEAPSTLVPLRLGTKPVGILATQSPQLDLGTLDALGGVVAIAIERSHFLAERKKAETLESARRSGVGAARVLQS